MLHVATRRRSIESGKRGGTGRGQDARRLSEAAVWLAHATGRSGGLVASPGTYDQKHVARIAGVPHCVSYGPGILELAHQPDEYCDLADLTNATRVLALTLLDLNRVS